MMKGWESRAEMRHRYSEGASGGRLKMNNKFFSIVVGL